MHKPCTTTKTTTSDVPLIDNVPCHTGYIRVCISVTQTGDVCTNTTVTFYDVTPYPLLLFHAQVQESHGNNRIVLLLL